MMAMLLLLVLCTLSRVAEAQTIAMHQLIVVEPAGDAVIRLLGYDNAKPSPEVRCCFLWCCMFVCLHATFLLCLEIYLLVLSPVLRHLS